MEYLIEDNCNINKDVKIGKGSIIKIGTIIEDDCVIGENCVIGPYAHIHSSSSIGDNCHIGNFVEIKKSIIGNNCNAKHLVYIGDCECGNNVNFGCGVVIANYNGKEKNVTKIKDNVFIGSNCNLIAPIEIGGNSFIAAGSTINKNVSDNEFVIERSEEIHKYNKNIQ